jgi:hypothetical protein
MQIDLFSLQSSYYEQIAALVAGGKVGVEQSAGVQRLVQVSHEMH